MATLYIGRRNNKKKRRLKKKRRRRAEGRLLEELQGRASRRSAPLSSRRSQGPVWHSNRSRPRHDSKVRGLTGAEKCAISHGLP